MRLGGFMTVVGESATHPEFLLRLPNGGPEARVRLLTEKGTNGSQKFVVLAGSPARPEVVPSFPIRMPRRTSCGRC